MYKPTEEPLAEEIVRLADCLTEQGESSDREALREELRQTGVDPAELKAQFHHSAKRIAERERAAKRPIPLGLARAIDLTRPAEGDAAEVTTRPPNFGDRWLERFFAAVAFPPHLESARAYRKADDVSKKDVAELDQLESELKAKLDQNRPGGDVVLQVSEALLHRFGVDCRERLREVAEELGIEVSYRPVESYDGALLRIKGVARGLIVINSNIRDEARRRFTLAHELGHYVLAGQQDISAPCSPKKIENWNEQLYRPELEANRFAAEILMPRELLADLLYDVPSFASIREIARRRGTSLTASAVRLVTLTSYRAAIVWSQNRKAVWHKGSPTFGRWVRKGELKESSFGSQCFKKQSVPDRLSPVPATAWFNGKELKDGAQIWEQSVALPSYGAVLSLLVIREPIEK